MKGATESKGTKRKVRRWTDDQNPAFYRFVVFVVGLLLRYWVRRYRAIAPENVPASEGIFLVSNHTSGMDPFLLGYPVRQRLLSGPGKVELFTNRFWALVMRKLGIFPVRTGVADAAAVRTMVELYRKGNAVIVYPEGGRSQTGDLLPFRPEFARLVLRLKASLIPAAIAGARELLPIGAYIPRFGKPVVVVYGDPFDLSAYYDRPLTDEVAKEAAEFIRSKVAELLDRARTERANLLSG